MTSTATAPRRSYGRARREVYGPLCFVVLPNSREVVEVLNPPEGAVILTSREVADWKQRWIRPEWISALNTIDICTRLSDYGITRRYKAFERFAKSGVVGDGNRRISPTSIGGGW